MVIQFIIGLIIGIIIFLGGIYFYSKHSDVSTIRCPNILIQYGAKYYLLNSKIARVPGVNPIEFNTLEDYNDFLKWQHTVGIKCPVLYVQKTYDAQGKRVFKIRPNTNDIKGGLPPSPPTYVTTKSPETATINKSTVSETIPKCGTSTPEIPGHTSNVMAQIWSYINEIPTKWSTTDQAVKKEEPIANPKIANPIEYPAELMPCPKPTFTTLSDDPMDVNWGGEDFTEKSVKAGKYAGSEITTGPLK